MDELELIQNIYHEINEFFTNANFMCNRAILASKNNDVDRINDIASRYFPGEAKIYLSA